jgi:type I restriction enzyme S subunit
MVKLGEVCRVFTGSSAPQGTEYFDTEGPFFFRVSDLGIHGRTKCLMEANDRLSQKAAEECQLVHARKGTVLFPKSGAAITTNNRAILGVDGYIVSHLMALEPTESILLDWLYYALCQIDMMQHSDNTGYPSLRQSVVEKIEIPLPPLSEQKRIATILNEQIAAVEQAREAAKERSEAACALVSVYLQDTFCSEVVGSWAVKPLGECAEIVSGVTLGRKANGQVMRPIPYLRVANVKDGFLDLDDVYAIDATESEIDRLKLCPGDILLTEGGDADKLGRGTIWSGELPECIHQNHIFRVRFSSEEFYPPFIAFQMASTYGKLYFLSHAKQTTGIATINQKVLRSFPLLVPPRGKQEEVATMLGRVTGQSCTIKEKLSKQLDDIASLPHVLLRRAFAGELEN